RAAAPTKAVTRLWRGPPAPVDAHREGRNGRHQRAVPGTPTHRRPRRGRAVEAAVRGAAGGCGAGGTGPAQASARRREGLAAVWPPVSRWRVRRLLRGRADGTAGTAGAGRGGRWLVMGFHVMTGPMRSGKTAEL